MGNTLTKSPQEFAAATARSLEKQPQLILEPVPAPPPPGYVRVHFHSHLFKIHDLSPPDITADIPRCRSGGLDLRAVKRQWGLDTCVPVDPRRWKPFEPTHPDYLSPVAVQVLSDAQGCIKVIEPSVSQHTLIQRHTRHLVLAAAALLALAAAAADTEKEQRRAARRLRKEQRALRRLEKTRLKEERRGKARADAEPQGEKKKRRRAQAENAAAAGAGPAPGQSDKKGKRRRDAGPDLTQAEVGADAEIVDKKRTEDVAQDEGAGDTERKRKRKRDTDTSPEDKARRKEERRRRKAASHSVQ